MAALHQQHISKNITIINFIKYHEFREYCNIRLLVLFRASFFESIIVDDILTTAEAARLLGVSTRTMQLWIENGAVQSWKTPGGHRRIRREAVLSLMTKPGLAGRGALDRYLGSEVPRGNRAASHDSPYPLLDNEEQRLQAVERSGLLSSAADPVLDELTWLTGTFLRVPISLITILTSSKQRFKSRQGLDVDETPREWAFCNYTILAGRLLAVEDLSTDPRFARNPTVMNDPHFRFYAGSPLFDREGYALGSLCVIDFKPRDWQAAEERALSALATLASIEIQSTTPRRPSELRLSDE